MIINQAIEKLENEIDSTTNTNEIQQMIENKQTVIIPQIITNQLIDEMYGKTRPIGKEIERNEIEMNPTGLIALHSIPNELDEIFNQFVISNEEKEIIKEQFDMTLESLILFIDKFGCDKMIDQTVFTQFATKHSIPIESVNDIFERMNS